MEKLRLAVYAGFTETGRAPAVPDLSDRLNAGEADVLSGLRALHRGRHLVLNVTGTRVLIAHPFSDVPLGFSAMGRDTLWWGGCAWDAFALPHLLPGEPEVLVATRCPGCGAALAWNVGTDAPPEGGHVAHFLVPVPRMWDDVMRTCGNQRLYCGERCVTDWLERRGETPGYTMDLGTLWRLAAHWYEGRLEAGYRRREPAEAAAYFTQVGLTGPFWGLED
ncbi:organomercurial lyase [Rhizohabitans arisaemae]|uniref:organomercurial lyase n=1 Tax=Rhizohabitans arisaemae TaxID=2720610 RepID=UPI0024B12CA1|nr:organomercurial lyase [Rhizohabitans arisaemae]